MLLQVYFIKNWIRQESFENPDILEAVLVNLQGV